MKIIDWQILNGDCLELMKEIPESSIDAVITDPPYCSGGISETSRVSAKGQGLRSENLSRFGWFVGDNMTTTGLIWLLRSVAVESLRILKPTGSILMFCDWRMLHNLAPAIESAGLRYQGLIVWDKENIGMGNGFRNQHEMIMHFTCGKPEYYNRATGNVIRSSRVSVDDRQHQTQKPVDLMQKLVNVVSPEGGKILDPFCGSGSTGVACALSNRNFIGIERAKEHCEIAEVRIKQVQGEIVNKPRRFIESTLTLFN